MNNITNDKTISFLKSILAGICISIGCICYLSVENKIIGALLFSVGLYSIIAYKLNLFTGKIGLVKSFADILACIVILFGNIVGCISTYLLIQFTPIIDRIREPLQTIAGSKTSLSVSELFLLGIICGILMLFATKDTKVIFLPMLCVATFILIGAEHSIADSFYLLACNNIFVYIKSIFAIVLGNSIGAIMANKIISL